MVIFLNLNADAHKNLSIKQLLFLILLCVLTYSASLTFYGTNNPFLAFFSLFLPTIISLAFIYFSTRYLLDKAIYIGKKDSTLLSILLIFLISIGIACSLFISMMITGPSVLLCLMFLGGH